MSMGKLTFNCCHCHHGTASDKNWSAESQVTCVQAVHTTVHVVDVVATSHNAHIYVLNTVDRNLNSTL